MPIIIDDILQGSPEWMTLRLGNPGGGSISKIITTKGERSKSADDYMRELAGEVVTGQHEETYQSIHMKNGLEREESGRALLEMIHDTEIRRVALVYKDSQKKFHVSLDGLIGDNAGFEQKNPMMKTHVKYLLANKLPTEYFSQVQMGLYVCEVEFWYFMSNYDGLPPLILKVERDEEFISKLKAELDKFTLELASVIRKLKKIAKNLIERETLEGAELDILLNGAKLASK